MTAQRCPSGRRPAERPSASWRPAALLAAVALLWPLAASPADADDPVPAALQAALIVRILAYDHRTGQRPPGPVAVAILQADGRRPAVAGALEQLLRGGSFPGHDVQISLLGFGSPRQLGAALASLKPVLIYVPRELEAEAGAISQATRSAQVLSIGETEGSVRGGLALGIVRRKARAGLIANHAALHAEGADLDAALLRLCEPVQEGAR